MATLGSDKLTGIANVDSNDSVVSKRYVDSRVPDPAGVTKSYLKAEGKSYSTWTQRTLNVSPTYIHSYAGLYGFIYSEKDNILLYSGYWTNNYPNYVSASTDAVHWALRTIPIPTTGTYYAIQGLNYANGIYFATGNNHHTCVSTDTVTWIARTSPRQYTNTSGTSAGNTNVLYGYSGTVGANVYCQITYADVTTTTDTIHWTRRTKVGGTSSNYYFRDGLYKDGYFMAVGGDSVTNQIQASTDAIHWQLRTFGTAPVGSGLYYIQYLDLINKYCVLGWDYYGLSTDAIHWTAYDNVDGQRSLTPLIYDNDFKTKKYYSTKWQASVSGYQKVYSTTDAINWIGENVFYNSGDYSTNAYGIFNKPGGGFIRPMDGGLYYTSEIEAKTYASETSVESPKGTRHLSYDRYYADQWQYLYMPKGVTSILVEWVRGSKGGYRGSPGSSSGYSQKSSPVYKTLINVEPGYDELKLQYEIGDRDYGSGGSYYASFKYLNFDKFRDVGYTAYNGSGLSQPYSSALGLNSSGEEVYLFGHSSGGLQSSIGSITDWTKRTCAISNTIKCAHFYNNTFFIGNDSGHTASSTDSIHWTKRTIPSPTNMFTIKDWNNLWRIFYGDGKYAVSTDAISWTMRTFGHSNFSITSGAYDSSTGTTILTGQNKKLASSTDDIHWTLRTAGLSKYTNSNFFTALSNNNGQFVIAGNYGDTQKSTDGIIWTYIDWTSSLGFSKNGEDDNQSGNEYSDSGVYFDGKFNISMSDYPGYSDRYYAVVSSTDTINWEQENFGENHSYYFYDFSYSDDLKTILCAGGGANGNDSSSVTDWRLIRDNSTFVRQYLNYNDDGIYNSSDYGIESTYNSGREASSKGSNSMGSGNDGGVSQFTESNRTRSVHDGFFLTTGGGGAQKLGDGGSVSKKYYGSTQTISGGSNNLTIFTLTVTNNGSSNYVISGTDQTTTHSNASNPTITVKSGNAITFDVNASGHPFWIKTAQTTGTGNRVPSYIVKNNGSATGKVIFNTVGLAAGTYYYICQHHSGMKGTINVTAATSSFDGSDGTSAAFSGNKFGMGGGGGAAFEQSPNFWTRIGTSEGFPDRTMFSNPQEDRFKYDSHYNFWVYCSYNNNANTGFAVSTDVIHWQLRTMTDRGSRGRFATDGNGTYVVQTYNASVQASTDTIHWTLRTQPETGSPYGIAYHSGNYIMQQSYHTIGSTDSIHWFLRTTGGYSAQFQRWAVGNGYVLAGTTEFAGAVVTSTDTIHWGRRTVSTRYGYYSYGYGFAGGLFHVSDGQGYGSYNTSTDSIHWTLRTAPSIRFNTDDAVKYGSYRGENVYFAPVDNGATRRYSTDAIHWVISNTITLSTEGASANYSVPFETNGSGDWYWANSNGASPDGATYAPRAFYSQGGDELYVVGNGGDAGPGCSGGGGGATSKFGGIGGLGGRGYINITWW